MNKQLQADRDTFYMKRALRLAERARGYTSPNPLVGAVVVSPSGKIVGEGYHKKAGLPHAEVEALQRAGRAARDATLYVTLEPCSHWGRTPPCVDAVLNAGIKRVVVAVKDPNPLMCGSSIGLLRKRGVFVDSGILEDEARRTNEVFFKNMKDRTAFVSAKIAMTLDGKIATSAGDSYWVTGKQSRVYARYLRGVHDAVLVGINTVLADDPRLDCPQDKDVFSKIVLDRAFRVDPSAALFKARRHRVIIVSAKSAVKRQQRKRQIFEKKGNVSCVLMDHDRFFSLKGLCQRLYDDFSITSLYVEGGSRTLGCFFDERMVDKIYFFLAPKIIGGEKALTAIGGEGVRRMKQAVIVKDIKVSKIGQDLLFEGYPSFRK